MINHKSKLVHYVFQALYISSGLKKVLTKKGIIIQLDNGTIFKTVVARSIATKQSSGIQMQNDYINFHIVIQ